eukprot:TRINITY_DN4561_c0_g1_i3.p1 TRINITY_DN4561_c0_g1~~TRINITY_DN4561_c0_g1_i3.p1  ORF type:complete len:772 (+),score=151.52 TRINITY_DN4561_c0_g1_i3:70-2385(+)
MVMLRGRLHLVSLLAAAEVLPPSLCDSNSEACPADATPAEEDMMRSSLLQFQLTREPDSVDPEDQHGLEHRVKDLLAEYTDVMAAIEAENAAAQEEENDLQADYDHSVTSEDRFAWTDGKFSSRPEEGEDEVESSSTSSTRPAAAGDEGGTFPTDLAKPESSAVDDEAPSAEDEEAEPTTSPKTAEEADHSTTTAGEGAKQTTTQISWASKTRTTTSSPNMVGGATTTVGKEENDTSHSTSTSANQGAESAGEEDDDTTTTTTRSHGDHTAQTTEGVQTTTKPANDAAATKKPVNEEAGSKPGKVKYEESCKKFMCGAHYHPKQPCQCNSKCVQFKDCCGDYHQICKHNANVNARSLEPFKCQSSTSYGEVVQPEMKGLALDDTTFEHCADQIPIHWPNTNQTVLSMRLFKPWGMTAPKWFGGDMHKAWKGLKVFAKATGVKFLIGVSVTCQSWNDEKEWAAGSEFIKYIGAKHIMGIAIGNEVDLQVGAANGGCINDLWYRGGYKKILLQRVKEFDAIPGMKGLPVTAVAAMQSMSQYPFKWKVQKFLKEVWEELGDRFVLSINVYPQFDGGLRSRGCHGAARNGPDYSTTDPRNWGFMPGLVKSVRDRMAKVGGSGKKLWIGETGWATHAYCVLGCWEACNARSTQTRFYNGFLKWDLYAGFEPRACGKPTGQCETGVHWAMNVGITQHPEWYPNMTANSSAADFQDILASRGIDDCPHSCEHEKKHGKPKKTPGAEHVFYFTVRDSYVFGKREEFGLVRHCGDKKCKF